MNDRRLATAGLLVALTTAGLAGCGSSKPATSTGSTTGATTGPTTGATFGSSTQPIRLMVDGLETPDAAIGGISFPQGATGAEAAAAALNASGGINGRKVQIDVCDDKGDPNQSAACGRLAKSNGDIALVGSFDNNAAQILPILQAEGIPYIGGLPQTVAEFTSPVSFQFDPGPVLASPGVTELWKSTGCTRVVSVLPANPGTDQILAGQKTLGAKEGVAVDSVLIPLTATDFTPIVASTLASKPNCITYAGQGGDAVKFIIDAKKLGYTGKIITSIGSLNPLYLHVLGSAGNGIIVLNSTLGTDSTDPTVSQFSKDLGTYLKGDSQAIATNSNEFAQDGWSSVQLVKQALVGSSTDTSAYLFKKIPTMCDVNIGNVYPHVDFCKSEGPNTLMTRVYNDQWQYFVATDGNYVPTDNTWHDLSATIPGK